MISILALCNLGTGSSMILKMKMEEMLRAAGVEEFEVYVNDAHSFVPVNVDLIFTSAKMAGMMPAEKTPRVVINNFFDTHELREKGLAIIQELSKNMRKRQKILSNVAGTS